MNKPADTTTTRGFYRLPQIIGNRKVIPPIPAIIPVSRSSWFAGIAAGKYPPGVLLGERTRAWRTADIDLLCDQLSAGQRWGV